MVRGVGAGGWPAVTSEIRGGDNGGMTPGHAVESAKGTVAAGRAGKGREGEEGAIVGICMNRSRLFGREMSGANHHREIIRNPCTGRP